MLCNYVYYLLLCILSMKLATFYFICVCVCVCVCVNSISRFSNEFWTTGRAGSGGDDSEELLPCGTSRETSSGDRNRPSDTRSGEDTCVCVYDM